MVGSCCGPGSGRIGQTDPYSSISRDISKRRVAEQERERLTRELKRSNEELSEFAHVVAHDLQSPLRNIRSFAQMLQRRSQDILPQNREMLSHIVDSTGRMQDLVQGLLKFAQVGQGDLEKRPVPMDEVLDLALRNLQLQINEERATVRREALPVVPGDSVQLLQVLQNLLGNALKYRRPDIAPCIGINASCQNGRYVFQFRTTEKEFRPNFKPRFSSRFNGSTVLKSRVQVLDLRHAGEL